MWVKYVESLLITSGGNLLLHNETIDFSNAHFKENGWLKKFKIKGLSTWYLVVTLFYATYSDTVNCGYENKDKKMKGLYAVPNVPSSDLKVASDTDIHIELEHMSNIEIPVENQTVNRFLNELYDKKLDINNKFSNEEINDIRASVKQQVTIVAKTLGDIDSRLKIQEIIPVGSASEETQIIRPCEFDYILILEALSKAGAVSLPPANKLLKYINVKVEDENARSEFQELSDDDHYLRASHWLPCFRQGVRDLFCSAINKVIKLNSGTLINTNTGKLRMRRSKPEQHGPAVLISFVWERNVENNATMEVSVDLCPALKLDAEVHGDVLLSFDRFIFTDLGYIESVRTVLLMPHVGHEFKVTFTEAELACTSNLSQHHRKCYKLLKYIVNGEPLPSERPKNCVMKHFQGAQTIFHSYALKTKIWDHHFKQHCAEPCDLYACIKNVLNELKKHPTERKHPFINIGMTPVHDYSERKAKIKFQIPSKENLSISRLDTSLKELHKIKETPTEKYYFEDLCRLIANNKCPAKCLANTLDKLLSISLLFLAIVLFIGSKSFEFENKLISVICAGCFLCTTACVSFPLCYFYLLRYLISVRLGSLKRDVYLAVFDLLFRLSSSLGMIWLILFDFATSEPDGKWILFFPCMLVLDLILLRFTYMIPRLLLKLL